MAEPIEMKELTNGEKSRTYLWPHQDGTFRDTVANVTHICVSKSGTHRLKTADGKLHIVPTGWIRIEIEADKWSI